MIGQKDLIEQVNFLIENKNLPHFIILEGRKGQGKTTFAEYISRELNANFVSIEPKIDDIRGMKDLALKTNAMMLFDIGNADKISQAAINSLLKITEECPESVYIVLELKQIANTLDTIKSRGFILSLSDYTESELLSMQKIICPNMNESDKSIIDKIAKNYYQIEMLSKYGAEEFSNYVQKVFNNIYKVPSANCLKISDKIDVKNDSNGYDMDLFFEAYKIICIDNLKNNYDIIYDSLIEITCKYQNKLYITGINRGAIMDRWILDVRKVWKGR